MSVDLARVERVYTGAGCHARLGEELERSGATRALLLTGRTLAAGRLIDRVREAAGRRIVAEFDEVAAHNPTSSVREAAAAYERGGCDAIVAFGAGSVADCAKAVSYALGIRPPLIDIATGLSGAEFACNFGQTDDTTRIKGGGMDYRLFARAVFLDPEMTLETPRWLWYATGMRAVDHAVESIFADNAHPYIDAQAVEALGILVASGALQHSMSGPGEEPDPRSMELRMRCFIAAWLAHAGSVHIDWGLSHRMGRQLGPAFGIPHGHTSAILLPSVVQLESHEKLEQEGRVAAALGGHAGAAAGLLRALVDSLELPASLRAAGIKDRAAVERLYAGNQAAMRVVELAW